MAGLSKSGSSQGQVFLDTSAYYALTDSQDINHGKAKALATWFGRERWRLFATNLIPAETHTLLLSRLGREIALRALREIDRSATTIVRATISANFLSPTLVWAIVPAFNHFDADYGTLN